MDLNNPPIDFIALAQSMGMPGQKITKANEIREKVRCAIATGKPNLIEIIISTE
jgi:benzoylformate decarboxylase